MDRPNQPEQRPTDSEYRLAYGMVIAALLLVIIYSNNDRFLEHHDAVRSLSIVLAAIIGFPLLVWRGFTHDRASRAAEKQAGIAFDSHVADTYTKAIEQLGSKDGDKPNLEIRLGGIFALEKIALADKNYHPQIMEVLCAYVRMNSPLSESEAEGDNRPIRIDAQTCLTVIGRRKTSFDKNLSSLDLHATNLQGAKLQKANLEKANLTGADLSWANLEGADLSGANLSLESLTWESPSLESRTWANLSGANLSGANLSEANLSEANLAYANLYEADLSGANLNGVDLHDVKNITPAQLLSAAICVGGKLLANDPQLYAKTSRLMENITLHDTVFPDSIKVTPSGEHGFTCQQIETQASGA